MAADENTAPEEQDASAGQPASGPAGSRDRSQGTRKIGIIGERDLAMVFKAVGVHAFPASIEEEAQAALETAKEEGFGILFVTANWTPCLMDEIDKIDGFPIVVEIPDLKGTSSMSEDFISKIIERAVGVDITQKQGE